jgi:NifU-like protein involved in Fe-S cluster formation
MDYPAAVERHFWRPANVGPLVSGAARLPRGEAGSAAAGVWVVIEADIGAGAVRALAFRALGCPYVIAACSLATQKLTGKPAATLGSFDVTSLAGELQAPAEKLGSLLILQDALRNCFGDWDTTQPAGAR